MLSGHSSSARAVALFVAVFAALVLSGESVSAQVCQGGLCQGLSSNARECQQQIAPVVSCSAQPTASTVFCRPRLANESVPKGYLYCFCSPLSGPSKAVGASPMNTPRPGRTRRPAVQRVTGCIVWSCESGTTPRACKKSFRCIPGQRSTCAPTSFGTVVCACS
jgi:hypothetical protein